MVEVSKPKGPPLNQFDFVVDTFCESVGPTLYEIVKSKEAAMLKKPLEAIEEHFNKVTDPRKDRTKEHKLMDIIAIAICAVICGAEGWVAIELYGKSKQPGWVLFSNYPTASLPMIRAILSLAVT